MELQPYQQRVLDELNDLDIKINKLMTFVESPAFEMVEQEHQVLLKVQMNYMMSYSDVLARRLDLWGYWEMTSDSEYDGIGV